MSDPTTEVGDKLSLTYHVDLCSCEYAIVEDEGNARFEIWYGPERSFEKVRAIPGYSSRSAIVRFVGCFRPDSKPDIQVLYRWDTATWDWGKPGASQ